MLKFTFGAILLVIHLVAGQQPGKPGGGTTTTTGVVCADDGSDYTYRETLSGTARTITTNHCPNHPWTLENPNNAINAERIYTVPAFPMYDESTQYDLDAQGGTVGTFYSGAMLYSAFAGVTSLTNYASSAPFLEGDTFDECGGHSSSNDSPSYHMHIPPGCLLKQLGDTAGKHSPRIGWADDGFPLYGPRGNGGEKMKKCSLNGNVDPCTDECGGYKGTIELQDGYDYRYYIMGEYNGMSGDSTCTSPEPFGKSAAEYYPFTPICFKGCCPSDVTCTGSVNRCSDDASQGYTFTAAPVDYADGVPAPNACNGAAITTPSDTTTDTNTASPTPAPTAETETETGDASATPSPTVADTVPITDVTDIAYIKSDLTYPAEIFNDGSTLTLKLDQHYYEGPFSSFYTRAFGPGSGATSIPGPTWRIKAGDTVKIKLVNDLGPHDTSYEGVHNQLKEPNTTNLHTHGLHITGDSPGDNVFTVVHPGHFVEYTYDIPSFHMPGTHWYHPHHHGSTSVQAGGGAAGMIIVEDTDDLGLPDVVTQAQEMPLFLQYLDIESVAELEEQANGHLWQVEANSDTEDADLDLYILINGLFWPKVQMEMNKWYRWRMVYAAIETGMDSITLDENCEMQLIAKDGVYLHTAPREISSIVLGPGNRADIMEGV